MVCNFTCIDVLRPIFAWVGAILAPIFRILATIVAVIFCFYGTKLLLYVACAFLQFTFEYLFTIQSVDIQFNENIIILIGWLAVYTIVWTHDINKDSMLTMWTIAAIPLSYNFIKLLVFRLVPIAASLDPFSLDGWMAMMQNENILSMVIQYFVIGNLCNATLMLIFSMYLKKTHLSRFGTTFILTLTAVFPPVGLSSYIVWFCLGTFARYWLVVPLAAVFVGLIFNLGLGSADVMFSQICTIAIGWAGLLLYLFYPKAKMVVQALFVLGVALPAFNFLKTLFLYTPKVSLCSVTGWATMMQDEYLMFMNVAQLAILGLATGYLILVHFYGQYAWSDKVTGKLVIFFCLLTTVVFPPVGLVAYIVLCWFIPIRYTRGYIEPPPILDKKPVHWGENLPLFPQFVFYFAKAVAGVFLAFLHLFMYIMFVVFTYYYSFFVPVWEPATRRVPANSREPPKDDNPTFRQFAPPSALVPALIRNLTGQMRVEMYTVPVAQRGMWWKIKFHILQFAAIVEIAPNANNPSPLSGALASQFGGVFPFADGIGIGDRKKIQAYLIDNHNRKGPRSLAGTVTSTQSKFSKWSTITMGLAPPEQGKMVIAARKVLWAWLREFDCNSQADNPSFTSMTQHFPPLHNGHIPDDQELYGVFGDVLYWMATPSISPRNHGGQDAVVANHGMLSRDEKAAYSTLVNNLFQFFPDWFNFLLFGGLLERQVNHALYAMRGAMFRDKGAAYNAAIEEGKKQNIPDAETLRLIVSVFAIAGAAVPAKLIAAILKRIASDPTKMAALYKKDRETFIKECARLDPAVFWVNLFTHKPEEINGKHIQEGTPCHLYIPFANLDPSEFGPNPLNFDPIAERVKKIFTWNGLEGALDQYPRGCPGHDVAVRALMLVTDYYLPQILEAVTVKDTSVDDSLDFITKGVVQVTTMRSHNWQQCGHFSMSTFSDKDLEIHDYYGFTTPTYDEDFRNNLTFVYDFLAQCLTLVPVDDSIFFVSDDAARSWRTRNLTHFPREEVRYSENPNENNTDATITRLAFFGLGCHRTRRFKPSEEKKVPTEFKAEIKYVNDVTQLGEFEVRDGFVKYGAKVYFDAKFKPKAIYLSCNKKWAWAEEKTAAGQFDWEFAKWVWKVSMFTYVTVHDHLLECHLIKANAFVTCSRQTLSSDNLLRVVLKPFTYQSIYINQLAGRTLIGPNALAARVFAFRDLTGVIQALKAGYEYPSTWLGMSGKDAPPLEDFPLGSDYQELLSIVKAYMTSTMTLIHGRDLEEAKVFYASLKKELHIEAPWSPPKFVEVLSDLILNGTGIHNQVGQISDVQVLPNLTGAKLVESMTSEPIQSYALNTALTSSTGIDQPMLLDNWSYLFTRAGPAKLTHEKSSSDRATKQYFEFKGHLINMSLKIHARKTTFPYDLFDPRVLETSVSK